MAGIHLLGNEGTVSIPRACVAHGILNIVHIRQLSNMKAMAPVHTCIWHAVVVRNAIRVNELIGLDVISPLATSPRNSKHRKL